MRAKEETNTRKDVEVVKFTKYVNPKGGPIRGFATVRIGLMVIKDIQLVAFEKDGEEDFSVKMPSTKGKNKDGQDEWYPNVWVDAGSKEASRRVYEEITRAILQVYPG